MFGRKQGAWLAVLLGLCAVPITAQEGSKPVERPQARLEIDRNSFDFGYVPQGASISHIFWLKNVGGDTLRITDVRPG